MIEIILLFLLFAGAFAFWDEKHKRRLYSLFLKNAYIEQVKDFDRINPRKKGIECAWEFQKKRFLKIYLFIICGLFFLVIYTGSKKTDNEQLREILRNDAFSEDKTETLYVTENHPDKTQNTYPLSVLIPAKKPKPELLTELLSIAKSTLCNYCSKMDLKHVDHDLVLPTVLTVNYPQNTDTYVNVTVEWQSEDYELITGRGILGDNILPQGQTVSLHAVLSYGQTCEEETFTLVVYPKSDTRSVKEKLTDYLTEEGIKNEDTLRLPQKIDDVTLSYSYEDKSSDNLVLILVLFSICIILVYLSENNKLSEQKMRRKESLFMDYPEIVTKLSMLLSAGLTVPKALQKITQDYEKRNYEKPRYGFEELRRACLMLSSGAYETDVYATFANRCELQSYLKLGTLLEENARNGVKDLLFFLSQEVKLAQEEKITVAKRLGEKARTRLLFPMLLLMIIVMIIVIVPAWMLTGI